MNSAEMKVEMFEFIASLQDEQSMSIVYSKLREAKSEIDEGWDELSPEQQSYILKSYEESYNHENWVDHEDVKKHHAKWLQK
jgi:hypothetical protein